MSRPVTHGDGAQRRPLPMDAELLVAGDADGSGVDVVLAAAYGTMIERLADALANGKHDRPDVGWAHLLWAVAAGAMHPDGLAGLELTFDRFVGDPLGPEALHRLCAGDAPVQAVANADVARYVALNGGGDVVVVDDGSVAARVLLALLGGRVRWWPPRQEAPAAHRSAPGPASAPARVVAEEAATAAEQLVAAIVARLAACGAEVPVASLPRGRRPLARCDSTTVYLAERHPAFRAAAAELISASPRAATAVDLLCARVMGALNIARRDVTDATELQTITRLLVAR